jgi:hypothetical protein
MDSVARPSSSPPASQSSELYGSAHGMEWQDGVRIALVATAAALVSLRAGGAIEAPR